MATREAWGAYLYKNYSAVAVNPTAKMRLLDVLIKTGHEGIWPRRTRIENVGTMLKLGLQGDRFDLANSRLGEGLKSFEEKSVGAEGDEDLFTVDESGPSITETSSSAASSWIGAVFSGVVDAHLFFKGVKTLKSNLLNVKIESVQKQELVEMLLNGQWLPDTDKQLLKWPQPGCTGFGNSGRELWVVHDILYADKVLVDITSTSDGGSQVSAPTPAIGMNVGAGLQVNNTTTGGLEITSKKGPIIFGFRAVRVQYNADGTVVRNHHLEAGSAVTRVHRPSPSDDPKSHMAGLFKDVSEGEGDGQGAEDDDLQVLDIVDATEASEQDVTL